jgi:hypothetical protein
VQKTTKIAPVTARQAVARQLHTNESNGITMFWKVEKLKSWGQCYFRHFWRIFGKKWRFS